MWKLSAAGIKNVNLVLGICNGIVKGVYRPERWEHASDRPDLWGFIGGELKDSPYMNKDEEASLSSGPGNR